MADFHRRIIGSQAEVRTPVPNDMPNNLKIRSPWSQLALFCLLTGAALVLLGLIVGVIYHVAGYPVAHPESALDNPRMISIMKFTQAISTIVLFGVPGYFFARWTFADRPLFHLGFRPADKSNFYLLAILLLVMAFPLEEWLGQMNKLVPLPASMIRMEELIDKEMVVFLKAPTAFDAIVNLVIVAGLAAFFEEMFFRGVLQRILIHICKSPWLGIIITGVVFSAWHMEFQGFLPRLLLGILLGAAYWYSGSLWTTILAHFFFNGIQVVLVIYYPAMINDNPNIPLYTVLISIVIVVGLLYRMKKQSTISYAQVFGQT
jgi:uncharacterized protein